MANKSNAQCRRVAEYLMQHGAATSLDLLSSCGALHSPRRVYELRHDHGWQISTQWQRADDQSGRSHRVASYVVLKAGKLP